MTICDVHCHFFSPGFFRGLGREVNATLDAAEELPARLGWEAPGSDGALADRWITELDRNGVTRAVLIASVPGDETSVAAAVRRHPSRFVGGFMLNPAAPDAIVRLERGFVEFGLRLVCLFPAMHHVPLDDVKVDAVFESAERHRAAVFVHCGLLSVGARKKLGLPSPFAHHLGNPLGVASAASRHPAATVIIPHFGAGFFREALMAAEAAPNILLDTSSSNSWIKFESKLSLRDVFHRALDCVGPSRLVFGTDSSFFPRGWQQGVFGSQREALEELGIGADAQAAIFGGNFMRIFP